MVSMGRAASRITTCRPEFMLSREGQAQDDMLRKLTGNHFFSSSTTSASFTPSSFPFLDASVFSCSFFDASS